MIPASPLQQVRLPLLQQHDVTLWIKRDDLLHPLVSGNKWRKLKYNLEHAAKQGYRGVLSFGGAYSNHIHALAAAAARARLSSVGIIRGEPGYAANPTLSDARRQGMHLEFVDRRHYHRRHDADFVDELERRYPGYWLVPEGGSNRLALPGVAELLAEIQVDYDLLVTAVGSGGTLAGLIQGDRGGHRLWGIGVLKLPGSTLRARVSELLPPAERQWDNWELLDSYHHGGYARLTPELIVFVRDFVARTGIPIEPIYTGKMLYALITEIRTGHLDGQRIIALHTGGLQGLRGLEQQGLFSLDGVLPAPG